MFIADTSIPVIWSSASHRVTGDCRRSQTWVQRRWPNRLKKDKYVVLICEIYKHVIIHGLSLAVYWEMGFAVARKKQAPVQNRCTCKHTLIIIFQEEIIYTNIFVVHYIHCCKSVMTQKCNRSNIWLRLCG